VTSEQKKDRRTNSRHDYPIWNEVKFIDRDPHWYTCRVKEAIQIRLHPNNINRDSGVEIAEAGCPRSKNTTTGERYNSGPLRNSYLSEQWSNRRIEMHQSQPTFVI